MARDMAALPMYRAVFHLSLALFFLLLTGPAALSSTVVSANIPLDDGGFCFYCAPDTPANGKDCGAAAFTNLACFSSETCTGSAIDFSSIDVLSGEAARVCVQAMGCLYLCTTDHLDGTIEYVFCCMQPGSVSFPFPATGTSLSCLIAGPRDIRADRFAPAEPYCGVL
jgi:hypothetical protein